jgi:hypothetical protein
MTVIAKQPFQYLKFKSRTTNEVGQDVAEYFPAVTVRGSVQPVPRNLYQAYGLEFQESYVNVYAPRKFIDVTRDVSGDQILFQGRKYQVLSSTPWYGIDGWDVILCVQVPC